MNTRDDVETEELARELWEAHATHHQSVIPAPQLHWDELDDFTLDHWRHVARTAHAFRCRPAEPAPRNAGPILATILERAELSRLVGDVAHFSVALPGPVLDEAFAVAAASKAERSGLG